jgi:hypothetical protein
VIQGVLVGRLAGRLELVVQVLPELGGRDRRQLLVDRLAEDRLLRVLEHHLQRVAYRSREEKGYVLGSLAHQSRANDRERLPRAAAEALELVEDDDEMVG